MLNDGETEGDVLEQPTIEGAELADELRDEPQERLSVRDALEKSWEKHGGELSEDRKRDRAGRFEKAQQDKKPVAATDKGAPGQAEKAISSSEAGNRQTTQAVGQPSVEAPSDWPKEAKAEWDRLSPGARNAIGKWKDSISFGVKSLNDKYGGLHQIVQRSLGPASQKYGQPTDRILQNALSWFDAIERNPGPALAELARTYHLDLSKLGAAASAPANGQSNGQSPGDPRIDSLIRTVTDMQQRGQEREQQATVRAKLDAWSANKPYYEEVRRFMGQLVEVATQNQDSSILTDDGSEVDLDKVYDRAIHALPEIRERVLKEQQEAKQEAARKAREVQVTNAKRAGSSVRPGTPGSGSARTGEVKPKKGMSVRDTIKAAMAELRS